MAIGTIPSNHRRWHLYFSEFPKGSCLFCCCSICICSFQDGTLPLHSERVIPLLLVQQSSSMLWTVPLILSHINVEPSFQLKGPPSFSYLKCHLFAADRER